MDRNSYTLFYINIENVDNRGVKMRNRGRKCRIRVTDSINEKLDAIQTSSSSDVYTPKQDVSNNFLSLVGEEVYFGVTEEEKKRNEKAEKRSIMKRKVFNTFIFLAVLIGFIIFISVLVKIYT